MTIPKAVVLIKRTIRVFMSFKEDTSEKLQEVIASVQIGEHRSIKLVSNSKIKSMNPNQLLQSLIDHLQMRLVDKHYGDNCDVINHLKVFDNIDPDNIRHGEESVRKLAERFHLDSTIAVRGMRALVDGDKENDDIKPLLRAINTIPVSSAECERDFSVMNNIVTSLRANLTIENISNLMFININGPPVSKFNSTSYVESWLTTHRSAADTQSKKIQREHSEIEDKKFWKIL